MQQCLSRYLPYDRNLFVSLTPRYSVTDIYSTILSKAGVQIVKSKNQSEQIEETFGWTAKIKAGLMGIGAESGLHIGSDVKTAKQINYEEIPINLKLPQNIADLLHNLMGNGKINIILENFHYLPDSVQETLSFDLRAFHELGVQFVVLGVWKEKNRLVQFNGDLLDRIVEIPVEPWQKSEFIEVEKKGAEILNITINLCLVEKLIDASFASIGVFQELLRVFCFSIGINKTQEEHMCINDGGRISQALHNKAEEYSSRYQRTLESMAAGNMNTFTRNGMTSLSLPYYLVRVILNLGYDGICNGMSRTVIQDNIRKIHHRSNDVRASDISNLLSSLAKMQADKNITPPIIDYDKSRRMLQVVDSPFYFFLKNADLEKILEDLSSPLEN